MTGAPVPGPRLAGKAAVITGAGSGMGRATALLFVRHGARVTLNDINAEGGKETVRLIREDGYDARFLKGDVGREEDMRALVEGALGDGLDILVNVAGFGGDRSKMGSFDSEDWHRVFDVNLHGAFYTCKYAIPHFLERGGGAIVNVASAAGVVGSPRAWAYTAAKHGLVGLTRSLALSYGRKNIRVNCVCPGITETPMLTWRYSMPNAEELLAPLRALTPMGRFGRAEEIAAAILYLASDEATFCSGAVLNVDGGYVAQ